MDIDVIKDTVIGFVRENRSWAPLIVAALAFGESVAVLSLFVPATVLIVGVGALIETGSLAFWPIWAGAAVGATLGDWVSFEFGCYFKDRARTVWPLDRQQHLLARGESFMQRFGAGAVFIGRFFGPVRAIVPLLAGILNMPRPLFLVANVASALVWALVLLTVGDVAGDAVGFILGKLG